MTPCTVYMYNRYCPLKLIFKLLNWKYQQLNTHAKVFNTSSCMHLCTFKLDLHLERHINCVKVTGYLRLP